MKNKILATLRTLILGSILLLTPQKVSAEINPLKIDCGWHPKDCESLNNVSYETFWGYLISEVSKVGDQATLECSSEKEGFGFGVYLRRKSVSEVFVIPYYEANDTITKVAQVTFTSDGKYIVHSQPSKGHLDWFQGAGGAQELMNGLREYNIHGCPEDYNRS